MLPSAAVVTLSQTERNLPTIANVDARDFSDIACWLIVQIGPISLNVTTPDQQRLDRGALRTGRTADKRIGPSSSNDVSRRLRGSR